MRSETKRPAGRFAASMRSFVLAACLPFLAASYWPMTNDAEVAQGQKAYRLGDYDTAVSAFSQAMRGRGDSDRLQFDLGTALLQSAMGATDEAERVARLDRSIAALRSATDSQDVEVRERALFNLGNAFALRLRYDEAVASYRRVLISNMRHDDARHNLGLVLVAMHQADEGGPGAQKGGAGQSGLDGQGQGQSGEEAGTGTDMQPGNEGQGVGAQGSEGGVEPGHGDQATGSGEHSGSSPRAETSAVAANTDPERASENLTVVQKLEALERRSGELRRGNLLQKSRSRLREPNKKGSAQ